MMIDTYFEGQRKTAVKTHEAGFTIVRMNVKNVPSVILVDQNYWDKLYLEDCRFENISGPAIEGNLYFQPGRKANRTHQGSGTSLKHRFWRERWKIPFYYRKKRIIQD
jgi:hypothetical protein